MSAVASGADRRGRRMTSYLGKSTNGPRSAHARRAASACLTFTPPSRS